MNLYRNWMMEFYKNRIMSDKNGKFPNTRLSIARKRLALALEDRIIKGAGPKNLF